MRSVARLLGVSVVVALGAMSPGLAQRREGSATANAPGSTLPTGVAPAVQLPGLESNGGPPSTEPSTPLALIEQALPRLEASVIKQCADRARKAKWETDNPRFEKCVCPQVAKWHLPKLTQELRVQRPLATGRNGYAFTAESTGQPQNCRVWSGPSAPGDDGVAWRGATAQKAEKRHP
jgi:hypothetical protein